MTSMIPVPGQDIRRRHVTTPLNAEVQPISALAAETKAQRAENFPFTDEDQALLDAVLAAGEPDGSAREA
jgi:hypothetical protein